jgi:hypothetical protein
MMECAKSTSISDDVLGLIDIQEVFVGRSGLFKRGDYMVICVYVTLRPYMKQHKHVRYEEA